MRRAALPQGEIRVVRMDSFRDNSDTGTPLEGYGLQLIPVNKSSYGEIGLREGELLNGAGKSLLLCYVAESYDAAKDPDGFAAAQHKPGDYSMQIGSKIWCLSEQQRAELTDGTRPGSEAGALVNHAWFGQGANCTFIQPRKGQTYPIARMTDNLVYGGFFLFDYEGQANSLYWKKHTQGAKPRQLPLAADAVVRFSLCLLMLFCDFRMEI